jgi:glycosyltransferase involved in cell wall biosynthesis
MAERTDLPLVAIVTPVYNGGKYLRQTMDCVQAQTYPNLVHVVLNNCSTDDSAEIIADYRDGRVPVLSFENDSVLKLADNWNKAFTLVPEDAVYAKLLCADDLIRRDAMERFVETAEAHPTVEVVLSRDVFADHVHRSRLNQHQTIFDGRGFVRDLLLGNVGWLAFHHFFIRIRPEYRIGRFIDDYWSPDPHVVLRSALRGDVAYLHEPLVYNRIHEGSVTGKELKNRGVQFELVHMHLLHRFAARAFSNTPNGEAQLHRAYDEFLGRCCRLSVRWSLTGQRARAQAMNDALAEKGYRFRIWDYARHLAAWPASSIRWRLHDVPPGDHIDEPAFLALGGGARAATT